MLPLSSLPVFSYPLPYLQPQPHRGNRGQGRYSAYGHSGESDQNSPQSSSNQRARNRAAVDRDVAPSLGLLNPANPV